MFMLLSTEKLRNSFFYQIIQKKFFNLFFFGIFCGCMLLIRFIIQIGLSRYSVLVNVSNQKPPLLEPKPAKTRPKNFYQKNHHNFRPNRHNFRNFEVEKLNFLQIPLMFTEKCENIAFFLPAPKNFFRHKKVPNRQKPANPPLLPTLFVSSAVLISRVLLWAMGHGVGSAKVRQRPAT